MYTGRSSENYKKHNDKYVFLCFFCCSLVFLVFCRNFHKGMIPQNTLQITLNPQKISPLPIFSFSTPDVELVMILLIFKSPSGLRWEMVANIFKIHAGVSCAGTSPVDIPKARLRTLMLVPKEALSCSLNHNERMSPNTCKQNFADIHASSNAL